MPAPLETRRIALRDKLPTYEGSPCKKCGRCTRLTKRKKCVTCAREQDRATYVRASVRMAHKVGADGFIHTGKPCRYGHIAPRYKNYACSACVPRLRKKSYAIHKDKIIALSKAYWKEKRKTPEGKAILAAKDKRRKTRRTRACPLWLTNDDHAAIRAIYEEAQTLSACVQSHHVDHIVPLQGKHVCGLHVPWNLQVLPATVNIRKSNLF